MIKYVLIVIYLFCTTGGITFMKLGGDSLKVSAGTTLGIAMSWQTFVGFLLYIVSFLLWQKMIVKYDISILVPIVNGIVQVLILVIGHLIFKESLNTISLIGASLIIFGIVLMAFGNR